MTLQLWQLLPLVKTITRSWRQTNRWRKGLHLCVGSGLGRCHRDGGRCREWGRIKKQRRNCQEGKGKNIYNAIFRRQILDGKCICACLSYSCLFATKSLFFSKLSTRGNLPESQKVNSYLTAMWFWKSLAPANCQFLWRGRLGIGLGEITRDFSRNCTASRRFPRQWPNASACVSIF